MRVSPLPVSVSVTTDVIYTFIQYFYLTNSTWNISTPLRHIICSGFCYHPKLDGKNLNEEEAEYRMYPLEGTYHEHLVQQHGGG